MHQLTIADNIRRLRVKKGITQSELAEFIGVTKASVSKWERNLSVPDIGILPILAAFFDISIDELIGFRPQLTTEEIRDRYQQLAKSFAVADFSDVMAEIQDEIKTYYSCHPFLFQLALLILNHYSLAEEPTQGEKALNMAENLCEQIKMNGKDLQLCSKAVILQALIRLQLGQVDEVIAVLEEVSNPYQWSNLSDSVLINAYLMKGATDKANAFCQITLYLHLISLVEISTKYLSVHADSATIVDETVQRSLAIIDSHRLSKLHPNVVAIFHYQAALAYLQLGNDEQALTHLEGYLDCVALLLSPQEIRLHGDAYFSELDHWIEALDLGANAPRDRQSVVQDLRRSLAHPAFATVQEKSRFQRLQTKLEGLIS